MKYILVFLVVFALGFGALQLMNGSAETESASLELPDEGPDLKVVDDSITIEQPEPEDTTTYSIVDGKYEVTWQHLSRVDFEERFNDSLQTIIAYPVFHPSVKKLDRQSITIKGYVIPFEETGDATIVILSAFPFSSCFFCGGAGPETVMDVQLKNQKKRFKQDAMVTFTGKLRLNDSDLDYLNYILDDAEVIED